MYPLEIINYRMNTRIWWILEQNWSVLYLEMLQDSTEINISFFFKQFTISMRTIIIYQKSELWIPTKYLYTLFMLISFLSKPEIVIFLFV